MSIPTGYERLAVIGIAWKDEYNPGTAYKTMNGVYYKGSTYVALRDNPTGPPAADGANWQYLAKGFEQQLLSAITALDTSGVLGQAGASVGGQALMDAIADKVMTKLVERSSIVQTESTDPTTVPSSPYFKKVTDKLTSDLDKGYPHSIAIKDGMPNNLLRIQGFNTDDAGISFYKPDGTVYRLSFISDGSLRYGKFINGAWTGVGNVLTNADIQYGTIMVNATANGTTEFTVNFSEIFVKTPVVIMSVATSRPDLRSVSPLSRDTKKVTGVLYNGTSAAELPVLWIAIAK